MGSSTGDISGSASASSSTPQGSKSSSDIAEGNIKGSSSFSPAVIAIVGILGAAFLVVSYYTMVAKYCRGRGRRSWVTRRHVNILQNRGGRFTNNDAEYLAQEEQGLQANEAVITAPGLEEALIHAIPVVDYSSTLTMTSGAALPLAYINSTSADCAVCLSEFQDAQRVRLLPSCGHAFHLPCIDVWLRSHASCPLCRMPLNSTTIIIDHDNHQLDPTSSPASPLLLAAAGGYFVTSSSPLIDNAHHRLHRRTISGDGDGNSMHTTPSTLPELIQPLGPEKLAPKRAVAADDRAADEDSPNYFSRCFSTGSSWSTRGLLNRALNMTLHFDDAAQRQPAIDMNCIFANTAVESSSKQKHLCMQRSRSYHVGYSRFSLPVPPCLQYSAAASILANEQNILRNPLISAAPASMSNTSSSAAVARSSANELAANSKYCAAAASCS